MIQNQRKAVYLPRLYDLAQIIPISNLIAEQAGAYLEAYKKKGTSLPTIDSLIAASATTHSYCLIRRNKKDYQIQELELY